MRIRRGYGILLLGLLTVGTYQNCSNTGGPGNPYVYNTLSGAGASSTAPTFTNPLPTPTPVMDPFLTSGSIAINPGGTIVTVGTTGTTLGTTATVAGTVATAPVNNTTGQQSSGYGNVSTGDVHACAIKAGALYCWGDNDEGELGAGNNSNTSTPVVVSGLGQNVTGVAAGAKHTCAVQGTALYCWGSGGSYQLGSGNSHNSNIPVAVAGMTNVTAVSAGYDHTCAIQAGALYCWGGNGAGQVGNTNSFSQSTPYAVPGFQTGVTAVSAGYQQTCAAMNGYLYCWGRNNSGELGIAENVTSMSQSPSKMALPPIAGLKMVTAVSSHGSSVCSVANGMPFCWGTNQYGQLGIGNKTSVNVPTAVFGLVGVGQLEVSSDHGCSLTMGTVYCWGSNSSGQLGDGTKTSRDALGAAVTFSLNAGETVNEISVGGFNPSSSQGFTCARTNQYRVFCWGGNINGQLGPAAASGNNSVTPLLAF